MIIARCKMGPGAHSLLSSGQKNVLEAQLLSDAQDRHRSARLVRSWAGQPPLFPTAPHVHSLQELTFFPRRGLLSSMPSP